MAKIIDLSSGSHELFGKNIGDYPLHHFQYPYLSIQPEEWSLQVKFAGRDEFIRGCWRERVNSDTFALEFVQQGIFEYRENGNNYICNPGDLFIVHKGADSRMGLRSDYGMKYTVSLAGKSLQGLLESFELHKTSVLSIRNKEKIRNVFETIFSILSERKDGCEKELSVAAYRILLEISLDREYKKLPDELSRIISYMKKNLSEKISIERLCHEQNIGYNQLFTLFRTHLSKSPIDYLISERMNAARSLLLSSTYSVKKIAAEVGYENPLYFSTEFRRINGISPKEYRQKCLM